MISISSLYKLNYSFFFFCNKQGFIKLNDSFICSESLIHSLYHVSPLSILPSNESYHISKKKKELRTNQTRFSHLHLGHINLNRIQRLVKFGILPSLIQNDILICESYIEGKMTKMSFITKGYRAKECLAFVHIDMCEPFNVHAWEGYEYFIKFIDDYFRFGYVTWMHRKFDAFDKFIKFKVQLKKQLG